MNAFLCFVKSEEAEKSYGGEKYQIGIGCRQLKLLHKEKCTDHDNQCCSGCFFSKIVVGEFIGDKNR